MKNRKLKMAVTLMSLAVSFSASAYFYELLNSHEMFDARIVITRANTGFVTGKICTDCKVLKFKVTPNTRAFNLKGNQVELKKANNWSGKAVVYTYDKKTFELVKIKQEIGEFK